MRGTIKYSASHKRWIIVGLPFIDEYGARIYLVDDKYHREDGPAYIGADGSKFWFVDGKRHREDGPAIEWADGSKEWWVNGKRQ